MSAERRVAIITGASQGIGAGLVSGYLERGYRVLANSREIAPSTSPDLLTVCGNVAAPGVADRIVGAALERFGRIDTLINNAGVFIPRPFADYSDADFTAMTSVNLAGFFYMSQRVLVPMLRQGRGHIVNVTTMVASQPMTAIPAVLASMTKGGLNAATRALAVEYAGRGIRVNAVSPGAIDTPMHRPEAHEFLATLHPMGRMGRVEEVVEAVLYLETAAFVTGEILNVDGGAQAGRW
jgi:NAD(P)-dependent dehydrogenase (short-subunit alcohol dehydrogenase family)